MIPAVASSIVVFKSVGDHAVELVVRREADTLVLKRADVQATLEGVVERPPR